MRVTIFKIKDDHSNLPSQISQSLKDLNRKHEYWAVITDPYKFDCLKAYMILENNSARSDNFTDYKDDFFGGKAITIKTTALKNKIETWDYGFEMALMAEKRKKREASQRNAKARREAKERKANA